MTDFNAEDSTPFTSAEFYDAYFWRFAKLLPFVFMFVFNMAVVVQGAESLGTTQTARFYQFFLGVFVLITVCLQRKSLGEMSGETLPQRWKKCNQHLSHHDTLLLRIFAWVLLGCFVAFSLNAIVIGAHNCASKFYTTDKWFVMIVVAEVFCQGSAALCTYTTTLWLWRLNNATPTRPLSTLYCVTESASKVSMSLLYVHLLTAEGYEIVEKINPDVSERHSGNVTEACAANLSPAFNSYYWINQHIISPILFLVAVETTAFIFLLIVDVSHEIRHKSSDPHRRESHITNEVSATDPMSDMYSHKIVIGLAFAGILTCVLSVGKATATGLFKAATIPALYPYVSLYAYLHWALQLMQLGLMSVVLCVVRNGKNVEQADLDVNVLFCSLPLLFLLYFAEAFAGLIPWSSDLFLVERMYSIVKGILGVCCYSIQFFGFKRMISLSANDLHKHHSLISIMSKTFLFANIFVLIDTWINLQNADKYVITGLTYYPGAVWGIVLIIAYPGLCFFNFHSVVCCGALLSRMKNKKFNNKHVVENSLAYVDKRF